MSTKHIGLVSASSYNPVTAVYANKSLFDPANKESLALGKSGYRLYVRDSVAQTIVQYNLATPWDPSTKTGKAVYQLYYSGGNAAGLAFNPEGTQMYVYYSLTSELKAFNLSVPWELSSAVFVSSRVLAPLGIVYKDFKFSPSGDTLYFVDSIGAIYQYSLGTPWNIAGAVYSNNSLIVQNIGGVNVHLPRFAISSNGKIAWIVAHPVSTGHPILYQFNLATPFNIATAVYSGLQLNITATCNQALGIEFHPDGYKFMVTSQALVALLYTVH